MKWKPFNSGTPYTCKDCPAYTELRAERDLWRELASEYYQIDTDCDCLLCERFRKAAGIDNETV